MKRRQLMLAAAVLGGGSALPVAAEVSDVNDAINKAGRQRMLSQRMVKSWMAMGQQTLPEVADKTMAASMLLFDRQLAELKAFAPTPEVKTTYGRLETAWAVYQEALVASKPAKGRAGQVLAAASDVLALSHLGTVQFEKVSDRPIGRLVNVAGRQRMLSQRMAAFYFSASWGVLPDMSKAEMTKARDEFVSAHKLLASAPETTAQIRDELLLAEQQFEFYEYALRRLRAGAADSARMKDVFTTSERILQVMDKATGLYSKLSERLL